MTTIFYQMQMLDELYFISDGEGSLQTIIGEIDYKRRLFIYS